MSFGSSVGNRLLIYISGEADKMYTSAEIFHTSKHVTA